jgi:hypothetical protein
LFLGRAWLTEKETRRREGRRGEKNVPSVIGRALPPPSLLVDREIDR